MRGWVAWVPICFAAAVVPRIAEACSFPCGLSIVRPKDNEAHPANAALHIVACPDYVQTMLSVTVDGVPASLGPADPPHEAAYGWVSISPPPFPGQEVVIEQCGEEAPTFGCPDPPEPVEVLRYVAGPDDLEAPPAAGTVTLAHTYGPTEVSCMEFGDVEFHVEIADLDQGAETAVLYIIVLDTGLPDGYSSPRRTEWVGPGPVASLSFDIGEHLDLATIPPEDACVTVTAMDLAGHVTPIAETCGSTPTNAPPSAGDDSSGSDGEDSGEDGTTTGDPPVDGTTTGAEPADTGDAHVDADATERGCACAASRRSVPGVLPLLALPVLALRRRHSPRR